MGKGRATLAAGAAVGVAAVVAVVRNRRGRAEARPVVSAANARESLGRLVGEGRASWEDLAAEFTPSSVHAVELLVEGVQFFPRIVEDLRRATSSIHIIEFGFLPGHIADDVNAVLIEKARSGVGVRVVVDENGSKTAGRSQAMYQELAAAGVETVVNNAMSPVQLVGPIGSARRRVGVRHLAHLDHRKVFVIDGRVGYVGGAGIEDHFFDGRFHDLFVRFEGALVAQLQYLFGASFMRLGGRLPGDDASIDRLFPDPSLPETRLVVPARLLQNVPTVRSHSISDILGPFIDEATASLDVINPYLTDRRLIRRLVAAAERGVKTRLVLPERPNSFAALAIHRHNYPRMLNAGIEVWGHPAVAHAKAMVRDGRHVLVGTCNLDAWSLVNNYEVDILLDDPGVAAQFQDRLFGPDIQRSRPVEVETELSRRLWNATVSLAAPLM